MPFLRRNRTRHQAQAETAIGPVISAEPVISAAAVPSEELVALTRAEHLCEEAETLHDEAAARAERVLAEARADATRLLRQALAVIDENVSRSEAARRQEEMDKAAAAAARIEAERLLERARQMQEAMTAHSADELPSEDVPEEVEPSEGLLTASIIDFQSAQSFRRSLADLNR